VYEEAMQEGQFARRKQMRKVDIHRELERMLGEEAEFRGLQEPAIRAIMRHESPILAVMGTGVGKSMLFMLPARSMSTGTTIVVTPLVSLQNHLVERCQDANISCMKWDPRESYQTTQIVIVTPESAASKTFDGLLDRLIGLYQLDRIVIDECHTVWTAAMISGPRCERCGSWYKRRYRWCF
jgi:superfamily II DNA helicase RecQ